MITLLPEFLLHDLHPSFYDKESVTTIELVGRLHGKVNEVVDEYNKFAAKVNQDVTDFIESNNKDFELFRVGLRQEFQDFIDVVTLKLTGYNSTIEAFTTTMEENYNNYVNYLNGVIANQNKRIEETHEYFTNNIVHVLEEALKEKVDAGEIVFGITYNEDTEELLLTIV